MMGKLYEADIKKIILEKGYIFGLADYNKSVIIFEKGIVVNSTICDCLIFTEDAIIGIEIKTEHDTIRRLNKQLKNYSIVCDFVYTIVHDDHVEKVEHIIENNYPHIGIIAYSEFRGDPILGIYRVAGRSPNKNVKVAFQMLWKEEISNLLGSFKRQVQTLEEFGIKVDISKGKGNGLSGLYTQSNASKKYLRKSDMINMIVNRIGIEEANRLLCAIFISERQHPEKHLKFHHFRKK